MSGELKHFIRIFPMACINGKYIRSDYYPCGILVNPDYVSSITEYKDHSTIVFDANDENYVDIENLK